MALHLHRARAATAFGLSASPNPAQGRTTVAFSLASAGAARLALYDVLGREIAVLHEGPAAVEMAVQTPDLAAGVYVAVLRTASGMETQRFTVVR